MIGNQPNYAGKYLNGFHSIATGVELNAWLKIIILGALSINAKEWLTSILNNPIFLIEAM